MKLTTCLAILLMTWPSYVLATTPSDRSLERLANALHLTDTREMSTNIAKFAQQIITQSPALQQKLSSLDDTKRQQIHDIITRYVNAVAHEPSSQNNKSLLLDAFVASAKKHYTQAEVDAQIDFYDSSIGQSIIQKQPMVIADFMQGYMPYLTERLTKRLDQLTPQMTQEIQAVLDAP